METYRCKTCGATLHYVNGETFIICEYCGNQYTLNKEEKSNFIFPNNCNIESKSIKKDNNNQLIRVKSCGKTIMNKKTFTVFETYAELKDDATEKIDYTIAYDDVKNISVPFATAMIQFKMKSGEKIYIKCMYERVCQNVMSILNKLI